MTRQRKRKRRTMMMTGRAAITDGERKDDVFLWRSSILFAPIATVLRLLKASSQRRVALLHRMWALKCRLRSQRKLSSIGMDHHKMSEPFPCQSGLMKKRLVVFR
mmetsp:Transcript_15625/g.25372  ORF Transcript_15625/g.25372 Transcript_15625/m.25372 type:complete len:105 (+) Transcript_15625:148-462(+)